MRNKDLNAIFEIAKEAGFIDASNNPTPMLEAALSAALTKLPGFQAMVDRLSTYHLLGSPSIDQRALLMRCYKHREDGGVMKYDHRVSRALVNKGLLEEYTPPGQYVTFVRITALGVIEYAKVCEPLKAQGRETRRLIEEALQLEKEMKGQDDDVA